MCSLVCLLIRGFFIGVLLSPFSYGFISIILINLFFILSNCIYNNFNSSFCLFAGAVYLLTSILGFIVGRVMIDFDPTINKNKLF